MFRERVASVGFAGDVRRHRETSYVGGLTVRTRDRGRGRSLAVRRRRRP